MDSRERLLELRNSSGMSRKEFCEYFHIPYRTVQDWELGQRKMPDYLLQLIAYKLEIEGLIEKDKNK
ncbi:MAG: helix-turn-helix domain-containing protein [Lachnospiraceae bacterium]|nr:helix-turn-helix domain-containing protein [Lachnospiraceae bacterium]